MNIPSKQQFEKLGRFSRLGLAAGAVAALTACVAAPPQYYQTTTYPYQPAYRAAPYPAPVPYAAYGRVVQIEMVQTQSSGAAPSGAGAVIGAVAGGLLGNQIGHGGGRAAATIAGTIGGAVLGNTIESNNYAPRVYQNYRVSVQMDDGNYRAFDVPSPGDLREGDRVRVDANGQISRAQARG
ncbi:glycine zipper 2TM domain-containing protein [Variovorax dokdonensis]|uniref:Glycine zipper 2TM domain-containing protein n=1 Tax=Variovorax dokdonensis TaxID=344883 RepID=A0ABT7NHC7_9BURK|nr:glycine zipper 2TM domain-containing protein [Variovorax dokdonensis]MDM0047355.1 glycine zipper 2TM domain-containing protein [Variovorax dokdonensis]